MNDDEFEREIRDLVQRVAGGDSSPGLRSSIRSLPDRHPRARRSRWTLGGQLGLVAILATLVVGVTIVGGRGPTIGAPSPTAAAPSSTSTSASSSVEPEVAAQLLESYKVSPELLAAHGGSFFGIEIGSEATATIIRIDPADRLVTRGLQDAVAPYFVGLAADDASLYVATNVTQRLSARADELLRIDESSMSVTGRVELPAGVISQPVAADGSVWLTLTDRVLRVDAVSMQVRASRLLSAVPDLPVGSVATAIAIGPDGIWVSVDAPKGGEIERFDSSSLEPEDQLASPDQNQGETVVGDPESLWLLGTDSVWALTASGQFGSATNVPSLQAAAPAAQGLFALTPTSGVDELLLQLDREGHELARTDVGDAGGKIAVDGSRIWLLNGESLAEWVVP